MFPTALTEVLIQAFAIAYKALDHGLIAPFVSFAKGFEFAIILIIGVSFFVLSVFVMLRQAKKLPKSYSIEIVDIYRQSVTVDGLRIKFKTFDAAESYARLYRQNYREQYEFKVVGSDDDYKR